MNLTFYSHGKTFDLFLKQHFCVWVGTLNKFLYIFTAPPQKCPNVTANSATIAQFNSVPSSLFTNEPLLCVFCLSPNSIIRETTNKQTKIHQ